MDCTRDRSARALRKLAILTLMPFGAAIPAAGEAPRYIRDADPSFRWEVVNVMDLPGAQALIVQLTSQTWQGIPWTHLLGIIRPEEVKHPQHAMLVISGGSNRSEPPRQLPREALLLAGVAQSTGTVIALLGQVPNQPLFDGLKEDALIAHTFKKFLDTGDETWPCLLPMAKSGMRAMDCVQALVRERYDQKIEKFFVTGASKRGWTTWLVGALDPRVAAIAPMVIDTLNMRKQMPHQLLSWGAYSEQIRDYTRLGLPERMAEPAADKLLEMVDPYHYRDRLNLPKLLLMGTNDPYWPVDAVNLYFSDLQGEKYIHYVPNAGHGLDLTAVGTITAFYGTVINGEKRPRFTWEVREEGGEAVVEVRAEDAPRRVDLWTAVSEDRDFRNERWSASPVEGKDGRYRAAAMVPEKGTAFLALYARLTYPGSLGQDYGLCTSIRVFGEGKPPSASGKSSAAGN